MSGVVGPAEPGIVSKYWSASEFPGGVTTRADATGAANANARISRTVVGFLIGLPETVMETVAHTPSKSTVYSGGRSRSNAVSNWGGVATWLLAALLVVYLGLENGGYDPIPRDQVGIAVWWIVLLGVSVEALPVPGRTRARPRSSSACSSASPLWTGLAFIWTESDDRTATELARVVTYLGVLVLGICLVTRRRAGAKHVLFGVTFGLALLAGLGVLSRLHMAWFPANELGKVLPGIEIERRLGYPLNYSSAMGALAGMTLPLLLAATAAARTIAAQALAAAAIPVVGLALYLSTSGTGAGVAVVAMVAFLAALARPPAQAPHPRRRGPAARRC